jgi:hypothetical protein
LKFLGTGFPSAFVGDAFAQQNVAFNVASVAGSFAFLISGASSSGSIATAGRFTADGGGNITNVVIDENNNGVITLLPNGTLTGSYTVDANQLGGGTLTWTDTSSGTFSFIFYLISPTQAVIQETDSTIISDGTIAGQTTTPISTASLAGGYVFGWGGFGSGAEDFVGQLTLTSSSSFSGAMDFNEFATGKQFFDVLINGSLTLNGDGATANTFSVSLQTNPADKFNFTAYIVNQSTALTRAVALRSCTHRALPATTGSNGELGVAPDVITENGRAALSWSIHPGWPFDSYHFFSVKDEGCSDALYLPHTYSFRCSAIEEVRRLRPGCRDSNPRIHYGA